MNRNMISLIWAENDFSQKIPRNVNVKAVSYNVVYMLQIPQRLNEKTAP